MKNSTSHQIRCRKCNRLLMKGSVFHIEIKCPKCGYLQVIFKQPQVPTEPEITHKGSGLL